MASSRGGVVGLYARTSSGSGGNCSRDPAAVAFINADPLIAHEAQPTRTVAELVRADERLKREFPLVTLPLPVLHGTEDKVDGHVHDLLNDGGREQVMADIIDWIAARLPQP